MDTKKALLIFSKIILRRYKRNDVLLLIQLINSRFLTVNNRYLEVNSGQKFFSTYFHELVSRPVRAREEVGMHSANRV